MTVASCFSCGERAAPMSASNAVARVAPETVAPPHRAEKILASAAALEGQRKDIRVWLEQAAVEMAGPH